MPVRGQGPSTRSLRGSPSPRWQPTRRCRNWRYGTVWIGFFTQTEEVSTSSDSTSTGYWRQVERRRPQDPPDAHLPTSRPTRGEPPTRSGDHSQRRDELLCIGQRLQVQGPIDIKHDRDTVNGRLLHNRATRTNGLCFASGQSHGWSHGVELLEKILAPGITRAELLKMHLSARTTQPENVKRCAGTGEAVGDREALREGPNRKRPSPTSRGSMASWSR